MRVNHMIDDDDDFDDRDDDDGAPEYDDFERACNNCYRPTCGEDCQQCGAPLCPMCAETGCGFCRSCPTDDYNSYGEEMPMEKVTPYTHCPLCLQAVGEFATCQTDRPFVAKDPMDGLTAWGAATLPKEILCYAGGRIVHFKYPSGERLVLMTEAKDGSNAPKRQDNPASVVATAFDLHSTGASASDDFPF